MHQITRHGLVSDWYIWFSQRSHQASNLNDQQLRAVAGLSNMQGFDMTLDPILIPRVVGTPNHSKVRQYIMDQMTSLGWHVETDPFTSDTPLVKTLILYGHSGIF